MERFGLESYGSVIGYRCFCGSPTIIPQLRNPNMTSTVHRPINIGFCPRSKKM